MQLSSRGRARMAGIAVALLFLTLAGSGIAPKVSAEGQPDFWDYPGTALEGGTSAEFERPLDDCRRLCRERSGCAGFDHSSVTNICRLFTGIGSAQPNTLSTAGTRNRIPGYSDPRNAESWYYAAYSGVDLFGGDLVPKGMPAPNAENCRATCDSQNSCRAFTYNLEANRCFLKSGFDFVQTYALGWSGLYFKAGPAAPPPNLTVGWELFTTSAFIGDSAETYAASYEECMQQCSSNGQCGGFTWANARPNRCYLVYSSNLYPVRRKGMTSARKNSRTVQPDFVRPVSPRN
ncbi:Uncharacterized protein MLTONO_p0084 (plasmid) [Mesorhizobium loti]|uniref:Mll9167 protein n=2 Tax=Mesorhizobium japonicum TaxID=2066070 RepID=Q982A0_RHILO|nr:mll9167 [Mesorhizobium japonicum MAFF 303099]BAV52554.1 Uncharacterized protein MLTONO_p0084 [Mesorhizobium loti]